LTKQIEDRFIKLEKNMLYAEAVILDPRFKKHDFLNINSFTEGKKTLIDKATNINLDTGHQYNTQILIPPTSSTDSIWNDFNSEVQSLVKTTNSKSAAIIEIDKYLLEPLIQRTADILMWWKENKNVYPRLFKIMKKRLCIMATPVPCERIFSKAGQTITEKRNRLNRNNFEKMIFLNFNM